MPAHVRLGGLLAALGVWVSLLAPPARPQAADEPPAGFTPLFGGKDLSGWKVYHGKESAWGAGKGILFTAGEGGGWLMTDKEYGDFELRLEFRLSVNGNSGVAVRSPVTGDPTYSGLEIQILDDDGPAYAALKPFQYTGAIYGVAAPSRRVNKPAGEWNRFRIVAQGRRLSVETNGVAVVDADLDSFPDKEKTHPGLLRKSGRLGLQSHGGRVEFRNLFVRPL